MKKLILSSIIFASCTQIDKTVVQQRPPTNPEIRGNYKTNWNAVNGTATLSTDNSINFINYPCEFSIDPIAGNYEYDENGGLFSTEIKSKDGVIRIVISGQFISQNLMEGNYNITVSDNLCDSGTLFMEHQ